MERLYPFEKACSFVVIVIGGVLLGLPSPGVGQVTDPGIVEQRVAPKIEPRSRLPDLRIEREAAQEPPAGAEAETFVLSAVILEGNTTFSEAELASVWRSDLGSEIPVSKIWVYRAQITALYRDAGYILSQAVVPRQSIEGGRVRLEIIEGYVDRVIIDPDDMSGFDRQFKPKIEKITSDDNRPLRADILERYMLLLNDLAGVSAQSILRPSPINPGASELVVFVDERKVAGSIALDSYGSDFLGPYEVGAALVANNLYGLYDSTEIRGLAAIEVDELQFASVTHNVPLSSEGTILSIGGAFTHTEPDLSTGNPEQEGYSYSGSLIVSHPLIRTRDVNLSVGGGFRVRNTSTDLEGQEIIDDRIRVLSLIGTFDYVDQYRGINLIGAELSQGLDIFGARGEGDLGVSRADGEIEFTKLKLTLSREQFLARGWSVLGSVTGQIASDGLLSSEEFGFGGEDFGRGYDAFEISGDHGIAGKIQIQYGSSAEFDYVESYQLYAFYDHGAVWNKDANADDETASSAGVGALLNLPFNASAKFEIGVPLDFDPVDPDRDKGDPRFSLRIAKRF